MKEIIGLGRKFALAIFCLIVLLIAAILKILTTELVAGVVGLFTAYAGGNVGDKIAQAINKRAETPEINVVNQGI